MIDIYASVTTAIADFVFKQTGQSLDPSGWRLAKDAPLAYYNAPMIDYSELIWQGVPLIAAAHKKNSRLLFSFTDAFYEWSVVSGQWSVVSGQMGVSERTVPADTKSAHLINRLLMLVRHGYATCPPDPVVQRALWLVIRDAHFGRLSQETERAILTMSHHKSGNERVALERRLGGVAAAMLQVTRNK
ncbi:MAG: hypothetical protein FWE69_05940 [Clostridiales bacterium]|nr:hypothetical protein [Clostridiales bacterium]